jgi:HD-GYP domain-containing protein (c-di-GMP phosphodiesterase class II)
MLDDSYENSEPTETINLHRLSLEHLSQTGSFVLSDLERTTVGKLFSAIPMPVVLVSLPDANVRFLNKAATDILEAPSLLVGSSLFKMVRVDVKGFQRAVNKLFTTRKQQRLEVWITAGQKSKWVRIHLRSLRLSSERLALVLIEDLTHEKRVLSQKATELERQNQLLHAEVAQRRKIETKLKQAWGGCIRALSKMSEIKDPHTAGHQRRVTRLAVAIAERMGLKEFAKNSLAIAAEVHDIGKLSVPVEILSKPSGLSDAEYGILKEHPRTGYDILREAQIPKTIAETVLQHHERINGKGYPQALKGNSIVLEARIIGVADVVEAMSSQRPYRPSRGLKEAAKEILQNKGILYDSDVVDACVKVLVNGFRFQ